MLTFLPRPWTAQKWGICSSQVGIINTGWGKATCSFMFLPVERLDWTPEGIWGSLLHKLLFFQRFNHVSSSFFWMLNTTPSKGTKLPPFLCQLPQDHSLRGILQNAGGTNSWALPGQTISALQSQAHFFLLPALLVENKDVIPVILVNQLFTTTQGVILS